MKDKSYVILDSCCNCKHVFRMEEYDAGSTFFCHQDKSDRPKCGSVLMTDEDIYPNLPEGSSVKDYQDNSEKASKKRALWNIWSKDRHVQESGKCKFWNQQHKETK